MHKTMISEPVPNKVNGKGYDRLKRALACSFAGIRAAWRNEEAFRQELIAVLFLCPIGLWLGANGVERALLVGSLCMVLIVELINSALEAVVDRIGLERHELSGRAKDLGSAAVGGAILMSLIIWALVLLN